MRQLFKYALLIPFAIAPGLALAEQTESLPPLSSTTVLEHKEGVSLDAIQEYLNGIKTMKANFRQIDSTGQETSGIFRLERPGRVRFQYDGDKPILIVSDGKNVNFIDYQLGQITRWPVNDTPLALLLDKKITFGDNVAVSNEAPGGVAGYTLVSAHDPKKPEQGTLTLIFTGKGGKGNEPLKLYGWEVVDAQGALTTVILKDLQTNVALKSSLWTYEDPRNERFERRRRH